LVHPASARTARDAGFSATICAGLAVLLHPLLPAAVAAAFPLAMFTVIVSGIGGFVHRAVNAAWSACIGDIARDGARSLRGYIRTRRLRSVVQDRLITREQANELAYKIVREELMGLPENQSSSAAAAP